MSEVQIPKPPANLTDEEEGYWNDICREVGTFKPLSPSVLALVHMMVVCIHQFHECNKKANESNNLMTNPNGVTGIHPSRKLADQALKNYSLALKTLGINKTIKEAKPGRKPSKY